MKYIYWVIAMCFVACTSKNMENSEKKNKLSKEEAHQIVSDINRIYANGDIEKLSSYQKDIFYKAILPIWINYQKKENEEHFYINISKDDFLKSGVDGVFYDIAVEEINNLNTYLDTTSVPNVWKMYEQAIEEGMKKAKILMK